MSNLKVTATLAGPIYLPDKPIAFDALLAWAVAHRLGLEPPNRSGEGVVPIEIPVDREPLGRFHLASFALYQVVQRFTGRTNKLFPIGKAQMLGSKKIKTVVVNSGCSKSYHIPREEAFLANDKLAFYCVGDAAGIEDLLTSIKHLGKRRAVGLGEVKFWEVAALSNVWLGFPVTRAGKALRNLPLDWGELHEPSTGYAKLTYPYWAGCEELLVIPETGGADYV